MPILAESPAAPADTFFVFGNPALSKQSY
jgi:hypothetical protein